MPEEIFSNNRIQVRHDEGIRDIQVIHVLNRKLEVGVTVIVDSEGVHVVARDGVMQVTARHGNPSISVVPK